MERTPEEDAIHKMKIAKRREEFAALVKSMSPMESALVAAVARDIPKSSFGVQILHMEKPWRDNKLVPVSEETFRTLELFSEELYTSSWPDTLSPVVESVVAIEAGSCGPYILEIVFPRGYVPEPLPENTADGSPLWRMAHHNDPALQKGKGARQLTLHTPELLPELELPGDDSSEPPASGAED